MMIFPVLHLRYLHIYIFKEFRFITVMMMERVKCCQYVRPYLFSQVSVAEIQERAAKIQGNSVSDSLLSKYELYCNFCSGTDAYS